MDLVVSQGGRPPFDPHSAVRKFSAILRDYFCTVVCGDDYGGNTFKFDFNREGIAYKEPKDQGKRYSASDLYEAFEPRLNNGEVILPDNPKLIEQLSTLVLKGLKVGHESGNHDDYANVCAGAVWLAGVKKQGVCGNINDAMLARAAQPSRWGVGGSRARPCFTPGPLGMPGSFSDRYGGLPPGAPRHGGR